MSGIQGRGRHCICRHTSLRGTGLRSVLFSDFCFGGLDLDRIVIVAASRAIAGLLDTDEIRAHLSTCQLAGWSLRKGQRRACERADGGG